MGRAISLILVACITPDVADFRTYCLGDEGLHFLHEIGLDEVYPSWINDYWLGVGNGGVVVIYGRMIW